MNIYLMRGEKIVARDIISTITDTVIELSCESSTIDKDGVKELRAKLQQLWEIYRCSEVDE